MDNKDPIDHYWSKVLKNSKTLKSEVIGDKDDPLLLAIKKSASSNQAFSYSSPNSD